MAATRRSTALSTVITVMAMLALTGCQDETTTDPTVTGVAFAKGGGGKDPKVESTDPTQAPQETTLDVQVFGSSFDDGSEVTFTIDGTPSDLVRTNLTTFVNPKKLIAHITIDLTAIEDLYDVEVLSSRGRKGIGADLFSVTKKGKPGDDEPQFTITTTDLGTLDGASSAAASGISSYPDGASIRVVGRSGGRAFFVAPPAAMVELATPMPSDPDSSVLDTRAKQIVAAGQVVGTRFIQHSDPERTGLQAIFWSSGGADGMILPTQARSSFANGVNNAGQAVGQSFDHPDDPDHQHAMLWTVNGGTVTTRDLHEETLAALDFVNSQAEDINDLGQVVGWAWDGFQERAFLWDNGVVTMLDDDVDPGFYTFAYAINNADPVQIIGGVHDQSGGSRRALLWTVSNGTVQTEELPVLAGFDPGWPVDLNDRGEAVGGASSLNGQGDGHAILWTFDPTTGARIVVDLGIGGANGIDNSASLGLTRVVGFTTLEVGKGRKKTRNNHAILWEVVPIIN